MTSSLSGTPRPARRRSQRALAALVIAVLVVATLGGFVLASRPAAPTPSPAPASPTPSGAPATPAPTASPAPATASPVPTPSPTPPPVAATTSGILVPWDQAALATRQPIAVMIDDQFDARPQAGLAEADIVYQAPAEGGIPRYMAIFQTQDPPLVGPIRSSRLYFVVWAAEWRAVYVHVGGAPNALAYLNQVTGHLVWNADEFRWGSSGYMYRATFRVAPHNVYSSGEKLQALAQRLGATAPSLQAPWAFADGAPLADRPAGGVLVVPYLENRVSYRYDRLTNTFRRSVTGEPTQTDQGTKAPVAPTNVIVLYQAVGALANSSPGSTNVQKGRLEINYLGTGRATVFTNGQAIAARWSKASEGEPTLLTYADGPQAGQPVALARGQTFVQIVPLSAAVTWTPGAPPPAAAPRPDHYRT